MGIPVQPLEYRVLVEVRQVDNMKGSLYLPESAQEKQQHAQDIGKVIAVGAMAFTEPDWPEHPMIGDDVLYHRYSGSVIRHKGKMYRLLNDKDIGGIVREELEG